MQRLCLHVGWGKTGTTTLQNRLFTCHSGVEYLGRPYRDPRVRELVDQVARRDAIEYDPLACRDLWEAAVAPRLESGRLVVLSEEHLTFNAERTDRRLIAQRLRDLFGPCRVIFTIRNQLETVTSYYLTHGQVAKDCPACRGGKTVGFEDWLEFSWRHLHRSYLTYLKYFEVVSLYADLFGRESVGVFLYEDLASDQARFTRGLCGFLGLDAGEGVRLIEGHRDNPRPSVRVMGYQRLRERVLPGVSLGRLMPEATRAAFHRFLRGGRPAGVCIPEPWKARLAGLYADGNRRLAAEYGLSLAEAGYPLAAPSGS